MKKGFTLIELMVVIVVLGIAASAVTSCIHRNGSDIGLRRSTGTHQDGRR